MTRLFYGFVAIGVALVISLAALFPLPENQRYRSSIAVIPDGGRQEIFTIEWPRDRLQPADARHAAGLLVSGGATILPADGDPGASAEIFRLRDVAGNIIGLASRTTAPRHAGGTPGQRNEQRPVQGSDWILLVPSRGALFMTQANSRDVTPRRAGATLVPAADDASFWARDRRLQISAGPSAAGAGQVLGGTGEFDGLRGSYDEIWELEEVAADGATRGRITLDTRIQAAL